MKNNKFFKIALIILTFALCIGTVFAITSSAEGEDAPKIISQNIEYGADYRIMYAVEATAPVELVVTDAVGVEVFRKTNETTEYVEDLEMNAYVFTTNPISHLNMTDVFTVTATSNGKTDTKTYSVAQYLYTRLVSTDATDAQLALYNSTIAYGNNLQIVINKEKDPNALIGNLRYVVVDGAFAGLYPTGTDFSTILPAAPAGKTWSAATYGEKRVEIAKDNIETSTYVIPVDAGVVAVALTSSNLKAGTTTFDEADIKFGDYVLKPDATVATLKFVTEGARGNVIELDNTLNEATDAPYFIYWGDEKSIANTLNIPDGQTATALELSFDMKVTNLTETTGNNYLLVTIKNESNTRVLLPSINHKNGTLWIGYDGYTQYNTGLSIFEWFSWKMVVYAGDPNVYFYINGTLVWTETTRNTAFSATNGDITQFASVENNIQFTVTKNVNAAQTYYIDNLFYGYTMEQAPTAQE